MAIRYKCGGDTLFLGRQGENLAREIEFDISEWVEEFGEGTVQGLHQRKADPAPYPINLVVADGKAVWTITSADTAYIGSGRCELRYVVGETLVKSMTRKTLVAQSLEGEIANPEALPDWVAEVLAAGEAAKGIVIPKGAKLIKYVESYDKEHAENIVALRDLDTGVYFLDGVFVPYKGADRYIYMSADTPVYIGRTREKTYLQAFGLVENGIDYREITDSTYMKKYVKLSEMESASHIHYVESMDAENMLAIRDFESGTYILHGYFTPFTGCTQKYTFSSDMLVSVVRETARSYVQVFYSKGNAIQYLEIDDDNFRRIDAKLVNMQSVAQKTTTVNEKSDDAHYPTAKAVYDAIQAAFTAKGL